MCRAHWNVEGQIIHDIGNQEEDAHRIVPNGRDEHDPGGGDMDHVKEGVEVATEGGDTSDGEDCKGNAGYLVRKKARTTNAEQIKLTIF